MLHPLLRLLVDRPHLLADHAQAYGQLLAAEAGTSASVWKRRIVLATLALCCTGTAITLAGVSVMLWAVVPAAQIHAPWALVTAPLLPAAAAVACIIAARQGGAEASLDHLRRQLQADLDLLREMAAP